MRGGARSSREASGASKVNQAPKCVVEWREKLEQNRSTAISAFVVTGRKFQRQIVVGVLLVADDEGQLFVSVDVGGFQHQRLAVVP